METTQNLAIRVTLDPSAVRAGAAQVRDEIYRIGVQSEITSKAVGSSASFSGERMARYATTAGMLTGTMQRLGIQNELVGRSINVLGDLMTGMAGKLGLVMIGVGALATYIADLTTRQDRLRKRTLEATEALVAQRDAGSKLASNVSEWLLGGSVEEMEKRKKVIEKELGDVRFAIGGKFLARTTGPGGRPIERVITLEPATGEALTLLREKAVRLLEELYEIDRRLETILSKKEVAVADSSSERMRSGAFPWERGVEVQPDYWRLGRSRYADVASFRNRLSKELSAGNIKIVEDESLKAYRIYQKNFVEPMHAALRDGLYGAFQAATKGADEFVRYLRDMLLKEVFSLFSSALASWIVGPVTGGAGGILGHLFGARSNAVPKGYSAALARARYY